MSGKRETETLILAKDSGKQFSSSGGGSVQLRGGEWCALLWTGRVSAVRERGPKMATRRDFFTSSFPDFVSVRILFRLFVVCRVGVRRFNEREAPNKLWRDDEAEGR